MSINLGKDIAETHAKIMSSSRSEFERSIARMPGAEGAETGPGQYRFTLDPGEVLITVTEIDDHVIKGSHLRFPRRRVEFKFTGATQEARNAFILQFDRTFQRGGG